MTTLHVKLAEEWLAELEGEVQESLGGGWYIRLSAPEVAVLVAAYRSLVAAAEAFDTGDHNAMEAALRTVLPQSENRHPDCGTDRETEREDGAMA